MSDDRALIERLAARLGVDRSLAAEARDSGATEDVCRADLGQPRAWIRPHSTAEVAATIAVARAERVPVVAAGRRTAYWRPLRFAGAIVLDSAALDRLEGFDATTRTLWCGAGASVRSIDDALRATGHTLVAHPDAFGGTSIGAMVATGFCSGVGMGHASIESVVAGLELVLGTGDVVRTGAAASLGAAPFLRTGLPDPTSLMFAAEGGLAIVTRVAVRASVRVFRCQLSARIDAPLGAVLPFAEALRRGGLYETLRVVDPGDPRRRTPLELDVVVRSPMSRAELDARVAWVEDQLRAAVPGASLTRVYESPDEATIPRFWGEAGEAWTRTRRGRFAPIDVNLGYADVGAAIARAEALAEQHRALPWLNLRRALYFAEGFVNFGLHWSLDPGRSDDAMALTFVRAGAASLAELPLIPYRWGRVWGDALGARLDPGYRRWMTGLRELCDPDGILNPGVSIAGLEP